MRQSNVCSPAQNQACLLITSRLYDRRGLDCTSPLPLFNSLAHLVHLTATSPKIREILTRDGGLERLVRILREFVQNPPPVQDPGVFYGLFPPIPVGSGNGNVATAIASLNPSAGPPAHYHQHYQLHQPFLGGTGGPMVDMNHNPALVLDPSYPPSLRPPHHHHLQPHATHLQPPQPHSQNPVERPFDRDAAQRFSLAFQSIVNVGVRGSESIRSRVVEAGTLEVVSTVLEAWLVGKGFPLVMPRRGKKREAGSANSAESRAAANNSGIEMAGASAAEDGDERMDEDTYDEPSSSMPRSSVGQHRSRNSTVTPHGHGRTRSEARITRPGSSSTANGSGTPRASGSGARAVTASTSNATASSSSATANNTSSNGSMIPRPSSSRNANNQTTPRYTLASLGAGQSMPSSSDSIASNVDTSLNSLTTPLDTPPASSASTNQHPFPRTNGPTAPDTTGLITRGRSGTIIGGQRVRPGSAGGPMRGNSTDDMDVSGSGRSGANTEDEDMDAESSNNENEETASAANTSTEAVNDVGVTAASGGEAMASAGGGPSRPIHRPVAVADPQALSPHVHSESLSIQSGGPGMGMGMEVDVLAAVNMVMAHEGVAAFQGTQFGGEAANAAAAEAMARAGREGIIMEEETPRAMLRNMSERSNVGAAAAGGELAQVDEEMGDGTTATAASTSANQGTANGDDANNNSTQAVAIGAGPLNGAEMFQDTVTVNLRDEDHLTLGSDMSPIGGDRAMAMMDAQPTMPMPALPPAAPQQQGGGGPQAQAGTPGQPQQQRSPTHVRARTTPTGNNGAVGGGAAGAALGGGAAGAGVNPVAAANADRFKVAHGDAGPFRQEDVLRSLQLLAYLTKYPHVRQEFYKKRAHVPVQPVDPRNSAAAAAAAASSSSPSSPMHASASGSKIPPGPTLAQVAPVTAALAAGQVPQITTLFSLVERFTFRPSMSHLNLHPSMQIPTIPPEIQSWAAVIMRNACRKDDTQGGIRQCANMTCGKWERTPREFAKCRRCRKAKYCGKECQSKAWSMGHRYWCSVREGTEPGQVPPESLDPENDDGSSTVVGGGGNEAPMPGTAGGNTRGMGISIAPGGGVGLVPLNQAAGTTHATRRTTTAAATTTTTVGFQPAQPGQAQAFTNRGPAIITNGNHTWDPSNLPPIHGPSPTEATATATTAAQQPIAGSSRPRRPDPVPVPSGSASMPAVSTSTSTGGAGARFTRGISERLRAFQGAMNAMPTANAFVNPPGINEVALSSSTSALPPPAPAAGPSDTSRPRAWERLFGRDAQSGSTTPNGDTSGTTAASNSAVEDPASTSSGRVSESSLGARGYLSVASRSSSSQGRTTQTQAQGQTDLSGMVRSNLVLAQQQQQQQQSSSAPLAGQWWRVAGSGPAAGPSGMDNMGVD